MTRFEIKSWEGKFSTEKAESETQLSPIEFWIAINYVVN